ncbi:MAG: hypothetical protein RBR97_18910, partial [Bacteroidales bacterium]|nr:hypothetical protein [Bacteroidales bacterium]
MKKIFLTSFLFVLVLSSFSQTYLVSGADATTCSGTFYDTGGSGGAYSNSENQTITFTPGTAGQMLQFTFTAFDSESLDHLLIYDGSSAAAPLIIDLNGHAVTLPYTVTATNASGQLTFVWTSDGSLTYAGWAATISCVAPPTSYNMTDGSTITTCSGFFLDPQGTSDYIDNSNTMTMTFCSGTAQSIKFVFNAFETYEANDNLKIYDGPTTGSTLIGTYSVLASPGTVVSSGTCLTFVWTTDNNHDSKLGWVATISCVAPITCSTCATAQVIPSGTTFPFSHSGTTCGACNNYSSSDACASNYLGGEEYVYEYTPSSNVNISVDLTTDASWVGVIVTQGCPDVG